LAIEQGERSKGKKKGETEKPKKRFSAVCRNGTKLEKRKKARGEGKAGGKSLSPRRFGDGLRGSRKVGKNKVQWYKTGKVKNQRKRVT